MEAAIQLLAEVHQHTQLLREAAYRVHLHILQDHTIVHPQEALIRQDPLHPAIHQEVPLQVVLQEVPLQEVLHLVVHLQEAAHLQEEDKQEIIQ